MTTMQKFKAYFGMVPPSDALTTISRPGSSLRAARDRGYRDDYMTPDYREPDYRETDYRDADYRDTDYRDADYRDRRLPGIPSTGCCTAAPIRRQPRESDYSMTKAVAMTTATTRKAEHASYGGRPINELIPMPAATRATRTTPAQHRRPAAGREHPARVGRRPTGTGRIFADGPLQ